MSMCPFLQHIWQTSRILKAKIYLNELEVPGLLVMGGHLSTLICIFHNLLVMYYYHGHDECFSPHSVQRFTEIMTGKQE